MRGLVACWIAACALTLPASGASAASKCKVSKVLELPITMDSLRPTIPVKINNRDAQFVLDSGAFFSLISSATAAQYKLPLSPAPPGFRVMGIGGSTEASIATVKEFTVAGVTAKHVEFLVGGGEVSSAGLLGQNLLQNFDVEYDLANGVIRLFRTEGCDNALLAYWVTPEQPVSSMPIERLQKNNPHTVGVAYLNGQKIKVQFDTGAFNSLLSTKAAERAGFKRDAPGVEDAGYSGGIGRNSIKTYIAPFASFKIGDGEEIKNARLRVGDTDIGWTDMLLGADFFVSHRIFVANQEGKLFLTYNGGRVFNLSRNAVAPPAANDSKAEVSGIGAPDSRAPADTARGVGAIGSRQEAAELARRGSAQAARRDFAPAIANLSKAIAMSPNEAEFYFQRANAYSENGQAGLALADFDHVILLKPEFLSAYLPRAELRRANDDAAGAVADLDALARIAPEQSDWRFALAEFYAREEKFAQAIAQFDLWIRNHPDDAKMVSALGGRCLASAVQNQDLGAGLGDCNAAIRRADKKNPNNGQLYAERGLLFFRQGAYGKALADFEADLKIQPQSAMALYGRGLVKGRTLKSAEADQDIAEAERLAPGITEKYQRYGLTP